MRRRDPAAEPGGRPTSRRRPPPSPRRRSGSGLSRWPAFYAVIARIPPGTVATYGQVADLAGYGGQARQVGYALAALPEGLELPWHRVVNAQGRVSPRSGSRFHEYQEELLRQEGIALVEGRIDLGRYRWVPEAEDA